MKNKKIIISLSVVVLVIACIMASVLLVNSSKKEEELRKVNANLDITEVFHDQANEYITPDEPTESEEITLRLRTEKYNVTKAQIQYTNDQGQTWQTADMSYEKHDKTGYYDYFVGTIPAQSKLFYYRFICANDVATVYVDRRLQPEILETGTYKDCWSVIPGFSTADWSKGALWYNINPDAFYNGDISNDVATSDGNNVNSWNRIRMSLTDKYGGDLEGVAQKVEHIKGLYADAIFMNPYNKNFQNGGYSPVYYNQVEPSFGNAQELQQLIDTFHEYDLKVGSDAVLTFINQDSIYFDEKGRYPYDGANESEDSKYKDLFVYYNWPDNWHQTWGQPAIDHNKESVQELLYTTEDSYMQYFTKFGMDSWRFDCGGWLYGTTEEGTINNTEVIARISENLKKINPELVLLSENLSEYDDMMAGEWDAHWNIYFMNIMQNYVAGLTNEAGLSDMLNSSLNQFPRPLALTTYNLLVNHDEPRTGDVPTYMETAQILTMMTYIGSPSIYYGEEINLDREKETGLGTTLSFHAMEWDESNWDYQKYNLYKSLGELRSKYSALKTGAIRELMVDNEQNIYAFGRWDDDGTVITVASQNKETVTIDLKARKLGVADGTIFTDWLTGKQYEVDEEGMLHVDVVPGGSILVKGKNASQYRQEYIISTLRNADAQIYLTSTDTYFLDGEGKLGTSDKLTLASSNLYGGGSIYSKIIGNGKAVLTIRQNEEKDAAAYFVTISEDKLEISARVTKGGKLNTVCKADYDAGSAVRITRDGNNNFTVSVAGISETGKITGKWKDIKDSTVVIAMEYVAVAGFAPLSGQVTLSNVTMESLDKDVNFDDFDSQVIGSMLVSNDSEKIMVEDGSLVISSKDAVVWATTEGKDHDWTFKVKLDSSMKQEGTYAGVLCRSDETQWLAAGRTVIDGESVLFVGRTTDGSMLVDSYVKDSNPGSPVVIQLQRVGSAYAAVYSYDDKTYQFIDDQIFANFSATHVGPFVAGKTEAKFDYVSFGDSIHDEISVNTPYSNGMVDVTYTDAVTAKVYESLVILSGDWEYGAEGYYQKDASGKSQLGIENKAYDDFRVNLTLQIEKGKGYAAIGFGKDEYDSDEHDGFLLKYTSDDKLILLKDGVKIAQATVKTKEKQKTLRILLEVKNSDINVYAGQNATRVMRLEDTGCSKGYISFYTSDAAVRFMNSRFTSLDSSWTTISGNANGTDKYVSGGSNFITCTGSTENSVDAYGATTLMGVGVTDFVTISKISLGEQLSKDGSLAEAGFLLCASEGRSKAKDGISVALNAEGTLIMRADGKEVGQYILGEGTQQAELMVVKKELECQVYIRGVEEPVMTYKDTYQRGGAYQLYVVNAEADFTNIGLEDIHDKDSTESELYQLWQNRKLPTVEAKTYRENFEKASAWESLSKYYTNHGTWEIKDGVLSCIDSPQWASGVTIYDRVFKEFKMEFKYRFNEASSAWAAVLLHKQTVNDHNGTTDFSVLFGSSGDVMLFDSAKSEIVLKGKIDNFKVGDWYQLDIVCKGDTLTVYNGTQRLIQYKDSKLAGAEGFISLTSNKSMVSFDDILIQPMKGDE